jgi:hypothetical protein
LGEAPAFFQNLSALRRKVLEKSGNMLWKKPEPPGKSSAFSGKEPNVSRFWPDGSGK